MNDRRVHASGATWEVVRYDSAGKWYLEPLPGSQHTKRRAISAGEAVDYAVKSRELGHGHIRFGVRGGSAFDREIRKRCAPSGTSEETG